MQEVREVLLAEDYVDQAGLVEDLLRRAGCKVQAIRGCSKLPRRDDQVLEGIDLANRPVLIYLASIGGVLLDGMLYKCKGLDLMPTFMHHNLFVVGQSSVDGINMALVQAGAMMALNKMEIASALTGALPPTSCFPWRCAYKSEEHEPVLKRFDRVFRRPNCRFFGSG